jgi:hypothetical protein
MDPHLVIAKTSLATELLGTLCEAYDNGWAEVAHEIGSDPLAIDTAREKLAHIILSLPRATLADRELLEITAIAMMRMQDNAAVR